MPDVSFFNVLHLNIPEWPYIFVGTICAMINGAMQPVFAILFSKIIAVGPSVGRHPQMGKCCALRGRFEESNNTFFLFFFLWQVFADRDLDSVRRKSEFISLMFVVIGCVSFVTMFLQVSVYYLCNVYL